MIEPQSEPRAEAVGTLPPYADSHAWIRDAGRILFLIAVDLAALYSSALTAFVLWAFAILHQSASVYEGTVHLLLLLPLVYGAAGLYPGFGLGAVESLRRMSYCTAFGFMVIGASTFFFKLPPTQSRVTFLVAWLFATFAVPLARLVALSAARHWSFWSEPTVLIGDGPWVEDTIASLQQAKSIGYRPVAVLGSYGKRQTSSGGVPIWSLQDAASYLREHSVRTAIISDDKESVHRIGELQQSFPHVILIRTNTVMPADGSRLLNLGGIPAIDFENRLLRLNNRVVKRLLDVSLAGALLASAVPVLLLAALYIRWRSPGPALFVQEREGFKGRPLRILKLRTMHADAEQRLTDLLARDPLRRDEWNTRMKLRDDPRLFPGARFLRRFSVDELPQLWNVIRGDMSLVGPRPFPAYHLDKFPPEFRELRRRVRPGLTGMWQVMSRSDGSLDDQIKHDTYYIRNWSLWLDVHLLTRTFLVVIGGRGAY